MRDIFVTHISMVMEMTIFEGKNRDLEKTSKQMVNKNGKINFYF